MADICFEFIYTNGGINLWPLLTPSTSHLELDAERQEVVSRQTDHHLAKAAHDEQLVEVCRYFYSLATLFLSIPAIFHEVPLCLVVSVGYLRVAYGALMTGILLPVFYMANEWPRVQIAKAS